MTSDAPKNAAQYSHLKIYTDNKGGKALVDERERKGGREERSARERERELVRPCRPAKERGIDQQYTP